jgi:hypothetical protein
MPMALPVPIQFELPGDWRAAPPDEAGAPGAAFVARYPQADAGFTANIAIDGEYRPDPVPLSEIAHASVECLAQAVTTVEVASRREIGSEDAPGFTQTLALSVVVRGVSRDLVRSQVYLSMLDIADPRRRAVIRLVLTATASQYPYVLSDFQTLRTHGPPGCLSNYVTRFARAHILQADWNEACRGRCSAASDRGTADSFGAFSTHLDLDHRRCPPLGRLAVHDLTHV